jgi:phosphate transport system permease protein
MKLRGNIKDYLFEKTTALFALGVLTLTLLLFGLLVRESLPAIRKIGASFATNTTWDPVLEEFGALPFLYGTVVSSFLAILIALPLGVGAAIFINEFAPEWLKTPISFLAELLAAIPSVIYGLWGIFVLVPILRDYFMKPASRVLGWIPFFQGPVYGPSMLAAGVLLSIMILPFILSVSREVLATVPRVQKEAVLSLGGTHWEMIRIVIGQHCIPGIFGATILGLGRALGETMAVTMVIGNRAEISASLFAPGYTMASMIANEFAEATSALYLSALVEVGLLLFVVTVIVNALARLLVWSVGGAVKEVRE